MAVLYQKADVDGLNIFFREAGNVENPTLILLHGFPTSSHMFRDLMPLLATYFHVVAPDFAGFGQSDMPDRNEFDYSFDSLARVVDRFTQVIGLDRFALYVFDYGAPIGFRIATWHPEKILAIISQNGNIYAEGLSDAFGPLRSYWADPGSQEKRDVLRSLLAPETTWFQYLHGVADPTLISPDGPMLDNAYLGRPGADEVQLELFADYASNLSLYPQFQAYLRAYQPPVLAVWGSSDPFFLAAGAEAFKHDAQDCEVELFSTGHFALETHASEIAQKIVQFLSKRLGP